MGVTADVIGVIIAGFALAATLLGGIAGMLAHQTKRIDARFEKVDARFEKVDARFEKVGDELRSLRAEVATVKDELVELKIAVARVEGPPRRLLYARG